MRKSTLRCFAIAVLSLAGSYRAWLLWLVPEAQISTLLGE